MTDIRQKFGQTQHGPVAILRRTIQRVNEERAAEAAASMAYYGFFSLFPLLLVMVAVSSLVLENRFSQEEILGVLLKAFPFSAELIAENLAKVLRTRGSSGLVGLVGLGWSASGAFAVLLRNVNRAWPNARRRNFIKQRLMALTMLIALIVGLVSLIVFNTIMRLLPPEINDAAQKASSSGVLHDLLIVTMLFVTLWVLYWWLPHTKVRWDEAAWGALVASLGIMGITSGFTWYVQSGLSNYNLVYGSLGAIVALLFWIYLLSLILFFGAHLSAAVAHFRGEQSKPAS